MGLCRFSYPSNKLLLVSSLYPAREEKVASQSLVPNAFLLKNGKSPGDEVGAKGEKIFLSLSLFPSFPIRLVLRSGVVNVVASLAHALAFARYSLTVSSQEIGPNLVTPG